MGDTTMPTSIRTCLEQLNSYLLNPDHKNLKKNTTIAIAMAELTILQFDKLDKAAIKSKVLAILNKALVAFPEPSFGVSDGREILLTLQKTESSDDLVDNISDNLHPANALYIEIIASLTRYINHPEHTNTTKNGAMIEALRELTTTTAKNIDFELLESTLRKTLLAFYGDTSENSKGHKLLTGLYEKTVKIQNELELSTAPSAEQFLDVGAINEIESLDSVAALENFFKRKSSALFARHQEDTASYLIALLLQAIKLHFNEKNAASTMQSIVDALSQTTRKDSIANFFNIIFQGKFIDKIRLTSLYRQGTIEHKLKAFELFCTTINSQKNAGVAKLANIIDAILLAYQTEVTKKHQQALFQTAKDLQQISSEASVALTRANDATQTYDDCLTRVEASVSELDKIKELSSQLLLEGESNQTTLASSIQTLEAQLLELEELQAQTVNTKQSIAAKQASLDAALERLHSILVALPAKSYEASLSTIVEQVSTFNSSLLRLLEKATDNSSSTLVNTYSNLDKLIQHINKLKSAGLKNEDLQAKLDRLSSSLQASLRQAESKINTNAREVTEAISQTLSARERLTQIQESEKASKAMLVQVQTKCRTIVTNYDAISIAMTEARDSLTQSKHTNRDLKAAAERLMEGALAKTIGVKQTRYAFIETTESWPDDATLFALFPDDFDKGYVFSSSRLYFVNKKDGFVYPLQLSDSALAELRDKLQPALYAQDLRNDDLEYIVSQTGFLLGGELVLDNESCLPIGTDRLVHRTISEANSFEMLESIINTENNKEIMLNERNCALLALTLAKFVTIDYNNNPDKTKLAIYKQFFPRLEINENERIISLGIKSINDSFSHTIDDFSQLILTLNPGFTSGAGASRLVKVMHQLLNERNSIDNTLITATVIGVKEEGKGLKASSTRNIEAAKTAVTLTQTAQRLIQTNDAPTSDLAQTVNALALTTSKTHQDLTDYSSSYINITQDVKKLQQQTADNHSQAKAEQQLSDQILSELEALEQTAISIVQGPVLAVTKQLTSLIGTISTELPKLQANHTSSKSSLQASLATLNEALVNIEAFLADKNSLLNLLDTESTKVLKSQLIAHIKGITGEIKQTVDENTTISQLIQHYKDVTTAKILEAQAMVNQGKTKVDTMRTSATNVSRNQQRIKSDVAEIHSQTLANLASAQQIDETILTMLNRLEALTYSSNHTWLQEIKDTMRTHAISLVQKSLEENPQMTAPQMKQIVNQGLLNVIGQFTGALFSYYDSQTDYTSKNTQRKKDLFTRALSKQNYAKDGLLDINKVVDDLAFACQRRRSSFLNLLVQQCWVDTESTAWMRGDEGKVGLKALFIAANNDLSAQRPIIRIKPS